MKKLYRFILPIFMLCYLPTTANEVLMSSLSLEKTGTWVDSNADGVVNAGELINYTFRIINSGTTTISNIIVTDALVVVSGTPLTLSPGAVDTTTFTATYSITQADINNGQVLNQATVTGTDGSITVTDTSDDPNNPTDVDPDGDGEPDDPTITTFSSTTGLLFLMDVTTGTVGGYADVTYTITNVSQSIITNITINHSDALQTTFSLNPSTLAPGATASATGQIAIAGDRFNGNFPTTGGTSANATGVLNGTVVTELSDGLDFQGNRVPNGLSRYAIYIPQRTGVIYIDVNLDGNYTVGTDAPIAHAVINIGDGNGNNFSVSTNETGWWFVEYPTNFTNPGGFSCVIDQNSFPASSSNYQRLTGEIPFDLLFTLASPFEFKHGYVDSNYGTIEATAFLDDNNNGIRETGEISMPDVNFEFISNNDMTTSTIINNGSGNPIFRVDANPGIQLNDVNATINTFANFYNIVTPNYDDITTISGQQTATEFAVVEVSSSNRDTAVYLNGGRPPNPGFTSDVTIVIDNILNGNATGTMQFTNDTRATILSVKNQIGTDLIANGTAIVNATGISIPYSLASFENATYLVTMSTPTTGVQLGDVFTHSAALTTSSSDNNTINNVATINATVVASYDPNDVTERRGAAIPLNTFTSSDYLEYTIRFQNLGTASAQFVRVLTDLDSRLDPSTFELITTSHDYSCEQNGAALDFFFDNIQLTAASIDEQGSNGFIRYKIKPLPGYAVGTFINARANIYFDYNPVVTTENWTTTFQAPASINDANIVVAYPIPLVNNKLYLKNIETGDALLYAIDGKQIWNGHVENGEIQFEELHSGFYILKIKSNQNTTIIKLNKL